MAADVSTVNQPIQTTWLYSCHSNSWKSRTARIPALEQLLALVNVSN